MREVRIDRQGRKRPPSDGRAKLRFLVAGNIWLKTDEVLDPGAFDINVAGRLTDLWRLWTVVTFRCLGSVPVYILPDGLSFISSWGSAQGPVPCTAYRGVP
jgi:hypothetical protein